MGRKKVVRTEAEVEQDRRDLAILNAPNYRARILGLIAAGHSIPHVVAVGEHHNTWTEPQVWGVLRSIGVRPPVPAFGGGAQPSPDARPVSLTEAQADVLEVMCTGASPDQIASRLFLSRATVHRHGAKLVELLDANDRAHAIALVLTGKVRIIHPERTRHVEADAPEAPEAERVDA